MPSVQAALTQPEASSFEESLSTTGRTVSLFPTTCFFRQHDGQPELNPTLATVCTELEQQETSLLRTSIEGGYHSERDFFERGHPAIQRLRDILLKDAMLYAEGYWRRESQVAFDDVGKVRLSITGWCVVLRAGGVSVPHVHTESHLSGVYYVTDSNSSGSEPDGGELVLVDPRIRAINYPVYMQRGNPKITPRRGLVVMFPSYLEHYVLPYRGDGPRISIAFNIRIGNDAARNAAR